jgi:hypothetical protein
MGSAARTVTVLVACLLCTGGCGAFLNGPTQRVRITTIPPDATVKVDGRALTSPCSVRLDRDRDYTVKVELNGFSPAQRELQSVSDATGLIWNCVLFLCIPQIWEGGSPSQYRLEPSEVEVELDPVGWSPR